MVKNVLIGKSPRSGGAQARKRARFVGLEFILNEARGRMVNRAFLGAQRRRLMGP
jgi:hypothetical protein